MAFTFIPDLFFAARYSMRDEKMMHKIGFLKKINALIHVINCSTQGICYQF